MPWARRKLEQRAVDGLINCWARVDWSAVRPHLFIPSLADEVVRLTDQCLALATLLRRPLGEDVCHRPRLRRLFLERAA